MKLRTTLILLAALTVGTLSSVAQVEKFSTVDAIHALVERHRGFNEYLSAPIPHVVHIVAKHADGTVFYNYTTHNLRTTGGTDWQANAMSATSSRPAAANYIALSNDGTAPAAGDCAAGSTACTLTSEIGGNGLARTQATYAHTNNTNSHITNAQSYSAAA